MKNAKNIAAILACAMFMGGCAAKKVAENKTDENAAKNVEVVELEKNLGKDVMTIGEESVSGGEMNFFINELLKAGDDFDNAKIQAAEMVESALLNQEVARALDLKLTEDEEKSVKANLYNIRAGLGGYNAFTELIAEYGVKEEFVLSLLSENYYVQKLDEKLTVEEATDEEKQEYFKNNYLRAKHVLITTTNMATGEEMDKEAAKATAEEVLAKAQAGENFDTLIETYNEDPGMSANPDGYVFTENEMVKPFEDKTRELAPGEIGICETDYGYHVILKLALDETPEKFTELYTANAESVSTAIVESKKEEALYKLAEEKGIKIEVNDDIIAKLTNVAVETEVSAE